MFFTTLKYWKNLWYQFDSWAFKRYNVVKPRYLDHHFIDRSHLLHHVIFEVLCDFIENELIPERTKYPIKNIKPSENKEWDNFVNLQIAEDNELISIYKWWTEEVKGNEEYAADLWEKLNPGGDDYGATIEFERKFYQEMTDKLKRVIELRGNMWT